MSPRSDGKERLVHKIREGYQINVAGVWRQVVYVSEGKSFHSLRRYYSFRLDNGATVTRTRGQKILSRNRKEVKKCGTVNV